MKSAMWKVCILLVALTMLMTMSAFAEGTIGLAALCLYGMSTVFGIQWAHAKAEQWEEIEAERAAHRRRAQRAARPAPQTAVRSVRPENPEQPDPLRAA